MTLQLFLFVFPLFLQPSVHNVFIFCQVEDNCWGNSKKKLKGPDVLLSVFPNFLSKAYLSNLLNTLQHLTC